MLNNIRRKVVEYINTFNIKKKNNTLLVMSDTYRELLSTQYLGIFNDAFRY